MKDLFPPTPEPGVRIELELFETAKRRAARLREAAIDEAVRSAARGPHTLLRVLRALLQRLLVRSSGHKETASCRS